MRRTRRDSKVGPGARRTPAPRPAIVRAVGSHLESLDRTAGELDIVTVRRCRDAVERSSSRGSGGPPSPAGWRRPGPTRPLERAA